jgi:hypothetical protein
MIKIKGIWIPIWVVALPLGAFVGALLWGLFGPHFL